MLEGDHRARLYIYASTGLGLRLGVELGGFPLITDLTPVMIHVLSSTKVI